MTGSSDRYPDVKETFAAADMNGFKVEHINNNVEKIPSERNQLKLEPTIGLFSGVNIIVGCIIGSGIFISPSHVLQYTGSVGMSLVVWTLCGVFSLLGALCFVELGLTIRESGGEYAYVLAAFGRLPAFLILWVTLIIILPAAMAIVSIVCADYIIHPFFPDCPAPDAFSRVGACLIIGELAIDHLQKSKLHLDR